MKIWMKVAIGAILALLLVLVFFVDSFKLTSSSALLPRILMVLIVALSLLSVYESWFKEKHSSKERTRIDKPQEEDLDEIDDKGVINYRRAFVFTAMIALYIFLLDKLGYFIVTPLFIVAANQYLKSMSLRNSVIIAALFSLFVYGVFVAFLKIPIPMGLLK